MTLLTIYHLEVAVDETPILQGIDFSMNPGEVHAIMGPNGSGKSTLANVLARKPGYTVTAGSIHYQGEDLLPWSPEEAAWKGIFLGFQYPTAIPGVSNLQFLKSAVNATRQAQGKPLLDAIDFLNFIKAEATSLEIPLELLYRPINDGFSGGEKKRNEILQMALLEPTLAILDETDSGLDIDALKIVAKGVNNLRAKNRSILLITHYQRLLDYIEPDFVHVLANGKMMASGGKPLATKLEKEGYAWLADPSLNEHL
jgi:Fe-S cluster assembly ATP-binding protein